MRDERWEILLEILEELSFNSSNYTDRVIELLSKLADEIKKSERGKEERDKHMPKKPRLQLSGLEGNAFSILGRARREARICGWSDEEVNKFMNEAESGDYDHLIQTVMKYFYTY